MDSAYSTLPTHQRRLRHLKSISCRNITISGNPVKPLPDLSFDLELPDSSAGPFYTSEVVKHSLNPNWKAFDLQTFPGLDTSGTCFVIRVWKNARESKALLIEWKVDLRGLSFLAPELAYERKDSSNVVIFELADGYYKADPVTTEDDRAHPDIVKVDKSKVKKSYPVPSLEKSTQLLMAKTDMEQEVEVVKRAIRHKFDVEAIILKKYEQRKALLMRQSFIQDEIKRNQEALERERQLEEQKRIQLRKRREELQDSKNKLEIGKAFLEMNLLNMAENRETLKTTVTYLVERRWELLCLLQKVFNVRAVDEQAQLYKVCGIPLPNTEFSGFDDDQIASALGYVSQAVMAISNYFEIPLRYTLFPAGSRSMIRDDISYNQGSVTQEFPLYPKGVERYRFDYGVFLLNKDIEQLLNARGHGVPELKNTLPNINLLFSFESQRGRRGEKIEKASKPEEPDSFEIISP